MATEASVTAQPAVSKNYQKYLSFNLINTPSNFMAGKTERFKDQWSKITSDRWILHTVCGYTVELVDKPDQSFSPLPIKFSILEEAAINQEILEFTRKGIIEQVFDSVSDEFISNIFARPKPDGGIRVILNLKPFNKKFVDKIHFKMESLKCAINAMTLNCYFASVDLKDAYYSIKIRNEDRKFFRFYWRGQKFQFTSLIMGLSTSPRVFTKVLKPVYATLRRKGHISTAYIDDSCLQGRSEQQCIQNVSDTVHLLDKLGFTVHDKKSVFIPSKEIVFVGFVLNSETMTVRLPDNKKDKIVKLCIDTLKRSRLKIRDFAKLIGNLVATEPGVEYAQFRYKPLELIKDRQLKLNRGNFDASMYLSKACRLHIQWWIDNLASSFKLISHGKPCKEVYTDSSLIGWGAFDKTLDIRTGGHWSAEEREEHINFLELKAAFLGLKSLCSNEVNIHVRLYMDNTTSCAYLRNFGGKKLGLNVLAKDIWSWCIERRIHLSISHVSGISNIEADELSRKINDDLEWALDGTIFHKITNRFGKPDIDLFASRLNHKLDKYVSFRPDPNAVAIDAFSTSWANKYVYIFAPFSTLNMVLRKIVEEEVEAIVVAPLWNTQSWWPQLAHLLVDHPVMLPPAHKILYQPNNPTKIHPLRKMTLGAFRLSGKVYKAEEFRESLQSSSSSLGDDPLKSSMNATLTSGSSFQILGKLIHLVPI